MLGPHGRTRFEARRAADAVEEGAAIDDRFHRAPHPGPVGELVQGDRGAPGQRVVERHDEHDLLLAHRDEGPAPPLRDRPQGEVGDAAFHLVRQGVGAGVLVEDQADARMGAPPVREDVGQDADGHRVHGGDVQFAALRPGGRAGGTAGLGGAADGAFGVREEGPAHRGEQDAARQPLQQLAADRPFQRLDLVGEGGLGDMEAFGGTGEGGLLDHRDEVLHLTQTHEPHLLMDFTGHHVHVP